MSLSRAGNEHVTKLNSGTVGGKEPLPWQPPLFFFSYNLVTRNQEKEKVELKPVAKAREERIVVI